MDVSGFQVWYMRPEFFRDGIVGSRKPDPAELEATHVFVSAVESDQARADWALEDVFRRMQGEVWSPNGEARELIRSKGLGHTSMSVGDVIVDQTGRVHLASMFGFEDLGETS